MILKAKTPRAKDPPHQKAPVLKEALLDSLAASAELERIYEYGEKLSGEGKALSALSMMRPEDSGRRVPGSRASIKDLLYFVMESTEHESVRAAARKILDGGR